ncbi:hypothetical protein F5Y10DRAFT_285609 [Nemania abortiva]|nr:hypothetical protein F5Y10DRAFT_285609 [Nemania abortiva]
MDAYTHRNTNSRSDDNKQSNADGNCATTTSDKAAQECQSAAETQMHQRLTEMRRRLNRTDKLFAQIERLRDQISAELTGLLKELPPSLEPENVTSDMDLNDSDTSLEANTVASDRPAPVIIPRVQAKPWNEMAVLSKSRIAPEEVFAIEIASNEPLGTFEPGALSNRKSEITFSAYEESAGLPERLQINSPSLKRLLLEYDSGLGDQNGRGPTTSNSPLTILRPFKILHDQYPRIKRCLDISEEKLRSESADANAIQGDSSDESAAAITELQAYIDNLRCLVTYMDDFILPAKAKLENKSDTVCFSELWYVFPPDTIIYVKASDFVQKVWCVIQRTGGRRYMKPPDHIPESTFRHQFSPFVVDCYFIDYDGKNFVPVFGQFEINFFDGAEPISSLPMFPLRIAEKEALIRRDELEARASDFIAYTNLCHRYYVGWSHTRTPDGRKCNEVEQRFDGEVIVDYLRAIENVPSWKPSGNDPQLYAMDRAELGALAQDIDQDWIWDKRVSDDILAQLRESLRSWSNTAEIPNKNYLLLLPDRVFAYVLRNRKWASLPIGRSGDRDQTFCPINMLDDPWKELYLPRGHKEMIQALVRNHLDGFQGLGKTETTLVDLVRGKGRGLTILLHGPPGVGKTSTAECTAAATGRPLFPITCGDLGTSPAKLEDDLSDVFTLAKTWGCVLLLDEADVFLSERQTSDIARNSLVSVFLRTLEYYSGILFLTTNKIGEIDAAFKSRVHLSLYYPLLDWEGTSTIWRNNITRAKSTNQELEVDEKVLLQYAQQLFDKQRSDEPHGVAWNGREIRNAFQSAIAIANFQKTPGSSPKLTPGHFQKVSEAFDNFNQNLANTLSYRQPAEPNKLSSSGKQIGWLEPFQASRMYETASNCGSTSSSDDTRLERPRKRRKHLESYKGDSITAKFSQISSGASHIRQSVYQNPDWAPSQAPLETLHHFPVPAPEILGQQQPGPQQNQSMSIPAALPNAQIQQQYPLPVWNAPQNTVLMPVSMVYGMAGMPMQQPLPMPVPIQYQNAAMNPYGTANTGPTTQIPPDQLRRPHEYPNSFQSPFLAPQSSQSRSHHGNEFRRRQSEQGSGGGFWGQLDKNH